MSGGEVHIAEGAMCKATVEARSVIVDGSRSLRELNGKLGLNLPLNGPKTLNGLLLDHLQDIPESGLSVRIDNVTMEILHTEDRMVRSVRLFKPGERP